MTLRIGINGFGRIGRSVFRALHGRKDIEVVGINDISDNKTLAYLCEFDTIMGRFPAAVSYENDVLSVDDRKIKMTSERNPSKIPWGDMGVSVVLESTGVFRQRAQIAQHIEGGAKKVLLSVPPKDGVDAMVVHGVNTEDLKDEHLIVSNASCTTNCLAPVVKVLHQNFGLKSGIMTTTHAYTNDQRLADAPHSDFRRARAAADNIIPTTTGAAQAVGKVFPAVAGKLDGIAARVPIPNGSIVDLVVELEKAVSVEAINASMQEASMGAMKGILEYNEKPIVSSDIVGNPHSSIFDAPLSQAHGDGFARVVSWYDNEWGYSNRCVDLMELMGKSV